MTEKGNGKTAPGEILELFKGGYLSVAETIAALDDLIPSVAQAAWKPIDDAARGGREILLRQGIDGPIFAGYFGLASFAFGAGASTMYPWTVLDNTNGVNHMRDGGENGITHYRAFSSSEVSVEPDELEALISDRSAARAADAILSEFILTRRSSVVPSTDEKSPVLNWKLDRPECPRCRGHGRVGIMACNDCGATGVVVSSTHEGGGK